MNFNLFCSYLYLEFAFLFITRHKHALILPHLVSPVIQIVQMKEVKRHRPFMAKWRRRSVVTRSIKTLVVITCFTLYVIGHFSRLIPSKQQTLAMSWTEVPPTVAIVVPFTEKDFDKVLATIQAWSKLGNPCPKLQLLATPPLHVLLWFNRDLDLDQAKPFAQDAKAQLIRALQPVGKCVASVRFDSAKLTDEEDPYPHGPSNQWYKLYLSPDKPLRAYDYFLWAEHDLTPVRSEWMDALIEEVTWHKDFFVRGSVHRGSRLDIAANDADTAPWLTHINGNAIYTCSDKTFVAMVRACYLKRGDDSFDVAMWKEHVTSYMTTWIVYRGHAHKFQYTEFMQNYGTSLEKDEIAHILEASPTTYMIHGTDDSAGEQLWRQQEASKRQHKRGRKDRGNSKTLAI